MMTKVQHNHPAQKKFSQHYQPTEISHFNQLRWKNSHYWRFKKISPDTSAQARSIFASACFLENDRVLVRPKSRRMGLNGGSLLTRKFPAYTHNIKFETDFFSYNGTGPPEMLNDCNLQWTYQSSTIRQHRCETNAYGDHLDKFRQNLELICRQLTSLPIVSWTFTSLPGSLKIEERCLTRMRICIEKAININLVRIWASNGFN